MANQVVTYCSSRKLDCGCGSNNRVILCLRDSDIITPTCCNNDESNCYTRTFIYAEICGAWTISDNCAPIWNYRFRYDDAQLLTGNLVTSVDIVGVVCIGCQWDALLELIGTDVSIEDTDEGPVLVNQHGCEYPITTPPVEIAVIDTTTVDLELPAENTIEANVIVAPGPDNGLGIKPSGLFTLNPFLIMSTAEVASFAAVETFLYQFSLLANSLSVDASRARIELWGILESNANDKVLRFYANAGLLFAVAIPGSFTTAEPGSWRIVIDIIRTSNTTYEWQAQTIVAQNTDDAAPSLATIRFGSGVTDFTAVMPFVLTGQGTTTGDIRTQSNFMTMIRTYQLF